MGRAWIAVSASLLVAGGALAACVGDLPPVAEPDGGTPADASNGADAPAANDGAADTKDGAPVDAPSDTSVEA